jgi:alcohol dehydrogenase
MGATVSTLMLLKSLSPEKRPKFLITHRFKVDRIIDACKTFGAAANTTAYRGLT